MAIEMEDTPPSSISGSAPPSSISGSAPPSSISGSTPPSSISGSEVFGVGTAWVKGEKASKSPGHDAKEEIMRVTVKGFDLRRGEGH